jgi:transcriptional regulator with XRE-family HTH domain
MPARDDLDALIDDLAGDDPGINLRVAAALERRQLARDLAHRRRDAGMTQADIASRMGTSQGQITRFESGADTRLSTVARYAAALGVRVEWTITPEPKPRTKKSATANRGKVAAKPSRQQASRRALNA